MSCGHRARRAVAAAVLAAFPAVLAGETLQVGPGRRFARIEEANKAAAPGDVILVHPPAGETAYERVAVYVSKARLTFRAAGGEGGRRVKLSGTGFDYSGRGRTPRAMFQFNKGADGGTVEGFEMSGAHNTSHNGAGVRVNQANNVTIRNCEIHHNDMGMMSNGDGSLKSAANQLIERCIFRNNGDRTHPGYNHNLYLGGTSVTMRFCEVHSALTGHNYKSRAHFNRVEYSYIHHSANREFDLVDHRETARTGSHAVLVGNVIVKDPRCRGNKAVIHYGQDGGGEHDGTLYLVHNTIVTPFLSPVIELSSAKAGALLVNNIVTDGGETVRKQNLGLARKGGSLKRIRGTHNWLAPGFANFLHRTDVSARANYVASESGQLFVSPARHDYRPSGAVRGIVDAGLPLEKVALPPTPGVVEPAPKLPLAWQYKHPAGSEKRPADDKPDLGAHEAAKR